MYYNVHVHVMDGGSNMMYMYMLMDGGSNMMYMYMLMDGGSNMYYNVHVHVNGWRV